MTPENIAGFTIPDGVRDELVQALAEVHEDNVVPIRSDLPKAA